MGHLVVWHTLWAAIAVAAAELEKTDRVLEIGPGLGPLTELLLSRAGHVVAIEKDARLVELLAEQGVPAKGGTPDRVTEHLRNAAVIVRS